MVAPVKCGTHSSVPMRRGEGRCAAGQQFPVSKKPRSAQQLRSPTPREQLLPEEDLTRPTAGSGSGSSLVPTPPWPRGAERPLRAPHRTLQLPKPKRGALLSAGIRVVVKRLHGLVHELQGRLGSFHGGGGGGGGSDGSRSCPRLLRLLRLRPSSLCRPQPLPDWRHLFFGRYQGRGVPGGSRPSETEVRSYSGSWPFLRSSHETPHF